MTKILLIYTGGTIGMIKNPQTGELESFNFKHIHDHVPELSRLNVEIESISFEEPIDSSEMNLNHWTMMAELIEENVAHYDGFVILHGSDTMAFSASALSFMLQGLRKPVVFTGSQLPIGTIRTDGKENLITAIEIAGMKDEDGAAIIDDYQFADDAIVIVYSGSAPTLGLTMTESGVTILADGQPVADLQGITEFDLSTVKLLAV